MGAILVVESNLLVLDFLRLVLLRWGHVVVTAQNKEQMLAALSRQLVDMIILDLSVTDSWELVQRLKRGPQPARIPLLATSSFDLFGQAHRAYAAGCDAYLPKPFTLDEFELQVTRCLGQRMV